MYRALEPQLRLEDFLQPFEGRLDPENRWVRLASELDWAALEAEYSSQFGRKGHQAAPFRVAFGAVVIQACLGLSDRQTAKLVSESPYLQYFLGEVALLHAAPFAPKSMVGFRRRVSAERVRQAVRRFRQLDR